MFRLVIALSAFLLIGAIFAFLADYPAEIILSLPAWRISLTPAAALALFLACCLALWLALALLKLLAAPFFWRRAFRKRQKACAYQVLASGLPAGFSGDSLAAAAAAAKVKPVLPADKEPLTALLLSRLENLQMQQERFLAETALAAAEAESGAKLRQKPLPAKANGKNSAADKALLLLALKNRYDAACAAADKETAGQAALAAAAENPALIWASLAAMAAAAQADNWEKALRLYADFAKAWRKEAQKDKSGKIQVMLDYYRQVLLCGQAQALFALAPHQARSIALQAHKIRPDFTPACALAAQILFQLDEFRKAEKLLLAQWRQNPQPDLARLYMSAGGRIRSRPKRLERLQNLAGLGSGNAVSPLLLAQAAFAAENYPLAQKQAEKAALAAPSRQSFILLAKLAQNQGKTAEAARFLAQALTAKQEKAWCADGQRLKHWQALAPISGRLGICRRQTPADTPCAEAELKTLLAAPAAEPQKKQEAETETEKSKRGKWRKMAERAPLHGFAPLPAENAARQDPVHLNVDNPGVLPAKDA